jgi:SAM-dependent methyltransferase
MTLRDRWEAHANAWIDWARTPGHDSYWRFHRDQFLELVPAPGRLTIDIGCGEGRLTRHLKCLGHIIAGIDASPSLAAAARAADPSMAIIRADAAALPLADGCADLVVAFMSLHDIDEMRGFDRCRSQPRRRITARSACRARPERMSLSGWSNRPA